MQHRPRRGVALLLIFGLLGLGAFDAEVCWGADGHLGLDTRFGSCCDSDSQAEQLIPCCLSISSGASAASDLGCGSAGLHAATTIMRTATLPSDLTLAADPGEGTACVDRPWIEGTPRLPGGGLAAAPVAAAVVFSAPSLPTYARSPQSASGLSAPILLRLRTTTLLI